MTDPGYQPGRMNIEWPVWRVILAGAGSLEEIERHWSVDDLADANEALDVRDEAEEFARRQSEQSRRMR